VLAVQQAGPSGGESNPNSLPGAEILLGIMLAVSSLMLGAATLLRAWLPHGPGVLLRVAHQRGSIAVVGLAIPFGLGVGYLIVLLQSR
jgi:hypothetical protein